MEVCLITAEKFTSNWFAVDGVDDQVRSEKARRQEFARDLYTIEVSRSGHIVAAIVRPLRGSWETTVHRPRRLFCLQVEFCRRLTPAPALMPSRNDPEHCCLPSSEWNPDFHRPLSFLCRIPAREIAKESLDHLISMTHYPGLPLPFA